MSVSNYKELKEHVGHDVEVVSYADRRVNDTKSIIDPQNVAIECETCSEVLLDYDKN